MSDMNRDRRDRDGIEPLLDYWFGPEPADAARLTALFERWFSSSREQDRELKKRFGGLAQTAAAGGLSDWTETPRGRLGLILLLDQLPRNLHRGKAAAFARDAQALGHCLAGIDRGQDRALGALERGFFYMPMQHAESREVQARSVTVFAALAAAPAPPPIRAVLEGFARYAELHRDIIERFGRFPHRNRVLERESTDAERDYLAAGGPSFGQ